MEHDEVWQAVDVQRRTLAELLEGLPEADWDRPSLCPGWRVRDVAAHVASAHQESIRTVLVEVVRARGNFDRMIRDAAIRHGAKPSHQLIAEVRDGIGSRRRPPATAPLDRLMDTLVHIQDIAVPLGLDREMPPAAALAATERVWTMGFPFNARKKLAGYRLRATDVDWSVGEGAPIEGPISALLLLTTGRTTALSQLTGTGAEALSRG